MENKSRASDGPLAVAIDSSTQSTKAILVDIEGNVLATAKRPIPLLTPAMDFYEHDPQLWWETTYATVGEVLATLTKADRARVKAMCVTHQRESFAPFTEDGTPTGNGILWLDGRAVDEINKYGNEHIHDLSGKPPGVTPAIYKMAWVSEHHPDIFAHADRVVDVGGSILFHLSGRWVSSAGSADSLGLLDIRSAVWSPELLKIAGLRIDQMPDLTPPAHIVDNLRSELCEEWGLEDDVVVIAGVGDGQSAGVGSAAVDPGVGYLNMGTAVNAGLESSEYVHHPAFRTHISGIPGNYVMEALQSSGSYLTDWVRSTFADPEHRDGGDVKRDDVAAGEIPPGSEGLVTLPYWNAVQSPYWDAMARGAVVGWRGVHSRAHFYRSAMEAVCLEMRRNLGYLESVSGVKLQELRIMGGGTRSKIWRQMMADVVGVPLTVCLADEVTAFGAAVMAMAGIGAHGTSIADGSPDVARSAHAMATFGETIEPSEEIHRRYEDIARIQGKLYPLLEDLFRELDAVVRQPQPQHAN